MLIASAIEQKIVEIFASASEIGEKTLNFQSDLINRNKAGKASCGQH
jgi:hypothetical protein